MLLLIVAMLSLGVIVLISIILISAIQTQVIPVDVKDYITTVNSQHFVSDDPLLSIQVPLMLIQQFTNSSNGEDEGVRVIAALYYNVEDLFPNGTNKYESIDWGIKANGKSFQERI